MSIFGKNSTYMVDDVPVFEGYDCEFNGDLLSEEESYEDQLGIIEAIHAIDMAELEMTKELKEVTEASDIEAIQEKYAPVLEAALKTAWEKIKKFFMDLFGKLKAFFDSVVRFFVALFASGKQFATKYEKQLKKLKSDGKLVGYKAKMYKYTNMEGRTAEDALKIANDLIDSKFGGLDNLTEEKAKEAQKKLEDEKKSFLDTLRAKFVPGIGGSDIDEDDFRKALFAHFRDGVEPTETLIDDTPVDIDAIIEVLKSGKELDAAKKAQSNCDKVFGEKINEIRKLESKYAEDKAAQAVLSYVHKYISLFSASKSIALAYFRAWKSAITERENTYKRICLNAFHYKKDKND